MNPERKQEKVGFSEDEDNINFHFSGNHGEITATLPKSEDRKTYEKNLALILKTPPSPIEADLEYIISMCDVNYEGIHLVEEEKQKLLQLLKEMFKDRLPVQ